MPSSAAGFAQRDQRFLGEAQCRREPPVEARGGAQLARCARAEGVGVRAVALVEQRKCALRRFRQPATVGEPVALVEECLGLASAEPECLELADLVAQQLEASRCGPAPGPRAGSARGSHARHSPASCGDARGQSRGDAVVVDDLALRVARDQRLEFLLAVDVDQQLAERAHALRRQRLAVHVLARAPVAADDPAQHQLAAVGLDRLLLEPAAHGGSAPTSNVAVTSARSAP